MPRPLNFYGELHSLALYSDSTQLNKMMGVDSWHRQHQIFIGARTKKAAVEHAAELGITVRDRDTRILTGDSVKAMIAEGLLVEGAIYAAHNGQGVIVKVTGPKQYEVVGKLVRENWRNPFTLERA